MENKVTAMASGSRSEFSFRSHCVTCGIRGHWTSRMWECDVCWDYFLCENCHKGSLDDSDEVLSAPPEVHNRDHHMSSHVTHFTCDGCESDPIWKQRWRCKVCVDFDLCEACHGVLGAADMPPEHSEEHDMIAIEVIGLSENMARMQPSFSKPVDPQWSFRVHKASLGKGFEWEKRKSLAEILSASQMSVVEDDVIDQTPGNANKESCGPILKVEEQRSLGYRSLSLKQASDTTRAQRMVDKKHKIFLSHAGAQKDFVEQLYRDLSRVHHFGIFFDKEDESLPKGESFPQRILDAAKQCELAVVVISEEYLVRKWPMLELAAFVEAQKTRPELTILPVFYKLSVEEVKKRQESFWRCWNEMPSVCENEVQKWKEAMRVICRTNGLEYDRRMGEVAFRETIVETVWKRVKPELVWDDTHVQGKGRMQELIDKWIQTSSNPTNEAPFYMGLFGMGGSGKTTMCKVFGNHVMQQFLGKVCYIEFGSSEVLQLRKKVLQSIGLVDSKLLLTIDEGQALTLLKEHIPKQKVCMIIDNVFDNQTIIEEARTLLTLPFKESSLILVTSRSSTVLNNLGILKKAMMRVPALSTGEAQTLFSQHYGCDRRSLTEGQKRVMENFVEQCNFTVEGMASQEYHPLALKVLGTRVGPYPEEWHKIRIDFKHYANEESHPIFSILRSSYDALNWDYQTLFLDLALDQSGNTKGVHVMDVEWQMRCLYGEIDEKVISDMVRVLETKSLVEFFDVNEYTIYIHDLYREFAIMEVEKKGLQHSPRCCLSRGSRRRRFDQEGRIRIENQMVSDIRIDVKSCTTCSEAELFLINDCPNLRSVDVSSMQNLRMLRVLGGCPELASVNLEGAVNLRSLVWFDLVGEYPDITSLDSLEVLCLRHDASKSPQALQGHLDFCRSSNLDTLGLGNLTPNLLNLNQAVQLRVLHLWDCQHVERFEGLEALVKLEIITLVACSSLLEFPSLGNFPCLKEFDLEGAAKLKAIHGFANLTGLQLLTLEGAKELEELPGIEACTGLTVLRLPGTSIGDCSWISMMRDLTYITLSSTKIRSVPNCSGLTKLTELVLENCPALESLGSNLGIPQSFPESLQVFSAENSRSVKAVPQFSSESALYLLDMSGTCVEDLSGVMYCKHLRYLYCAETRITSIPDLSCQASLEHLDVHGCELLTRTDNLKGLSALECLDVQGCTKLLALPDLGMSNGLTAVSLRNCPLVDPNLVKVPRGSSTVVVDTKDAAGEFSDREVGGEECEIQTSSVIDSQKPEPCSVEWRSARVFNLVALSGVVVWWLGRKLGKR